MNAFAAVKRFAAALEIEWLPWANARLPWRYSCLSCESGSGFGRFQSLAEALDARASHQCPGAA